MTARQPVQSFRGMRALVLHGPDHNRSVLERTLRRLGLKVTVLDAAADEGLPEATGCGADLVFVDADASLTAQLPAAPGSLPLITMIGHETPSRLQRALEMQPTAFLLKPVRPQGVFTAIFFAVNEHRRRAEVEAERRGLHERHAARRFVTKAILHIMQRYGADDDEAFRRLRRLSMAQRMTIEELSRQIVEAAGHGPTAVRAGGRDGPC